MKTFLILMAMLLGVETSLSQSQYEFRDTLNASFKRYQIFSKNDSSDKETYVVSVINEGTHRLWVSNTYTTNSAGVNIPDTTTTSTGYQKPITLLGGDQIDFTLLRNSYFYLKGTSTTDTVHVIAVKQKTNQR